MSDSYDLLVERVAGFQERVRGRYPDALTCHMGCSGCCHQHLSVVPTEFRRIIAAVDALGEDAREALVSRLRGGRDDPRCPLLDDAGRCRVYQARPMICRTHGLPIEIGDPPQRDVCPLNFVEGPGPDELDDDLVLDVNRLNLILGLIERVEGEEAQERIDLWTGLERVLAVTAPPAAGDFDPTQ